jgi:hypothetical protein
MRKNRTVEKPHPSGHPIGGAVHAFDVETPKERRHPSVVHGVLGLTA